MTISMNRNISVLLVINLLLVHPTVQAEAKQNTPKPQVSCESDGVSGWSPDGNKILFVSERIGNGDIWIMDANGENPIDLTAASDAIDINPVWSPDGKYIAFLSKRENASNLWLMNADGSGLQSLDADSSHGYGSPAWAKDGNSIAAPFVNGEKIDIGLIDMKTKTLRNLTQNSGISFKGVSWSPDGTKLVATTSANTDVYVMNADGSHLAVVESEPFNIQVTYSPVDDTILVTKTPQIGADNHEIWLINLHDNKRTNLTEAIIGLNLSPAWSPDGQSIILISGVGKIWKMTATGSNRVKVMDNSDSAAILQLAWSPDSTKIAFSTLQTEENNTWKADIFVMNADGSGLTNLSAVGCAKQ